MTTPQAGLSEAPGSFSSRVSDAVTAAITSSGKSVRQVALDALIPEQTFRRRLAGSPFTVEELGRVGQALDVDPASFAQAAESSEAVA